MTETAGGEAAGRWPVLVLLVVLGGAAWLRFSLATADTETLLLRATSDDAFYYFQIAREWMQGGPPSLDGETPTNGFHPLWLWLCAAAWAAAPDAETSVRVALCVGAAMGVATTAVSFAILRRLGTSPGVALIGAAAFGLHPAFATDSVNGLETSLCVFALAIVVWLFLGIASASGALRSGACAGLGLAGGALLLARTDMVFAWAGIVAFLAARAWRRGGLAGAAAAAAVSAIVVTPWLLWSAARLGGIVQVSGYAISEPARASYLASHGDGLAVVLGRSFFLLREAFLDKLFHFYAVPAGWPHAPFWLAAAALLAALVLAPFEPERSRSRRRLALLMVPGAGVLLALAWHAGVRWWTREWYFAPAGWLGVLVLGLGFALARELLERVPAPRRRAAVAASSALALLCLAVLLWPGDGTRWGSRTPHRVTQLEAARWIRANLPPDARLGAFNAGILAWFSERTVVNLDGAVNADAYAARRRGEMMDYILARRIEYLADWRGYLPMAGCHGSRAARCETLASLGIPHESFGPGPLLLVRVHPLAPATP